MQRIAVMRLIICNLRNYSIKYESSCLARMIHRHNYRYLRGWKSFRRIITKHTGLRMSDILYCSCWFRKCRRKQSKQWKSIPSHQNRIKIAIDDDLERYSSVDEVEVDNDEYKVSHHQRRRNNNCCNDCYCSCNNIYIADSCNGCGECLGQICAGCGHCLSSIRCDDCVCCIVYHTDNVGECTQCCKACCDICGGCGNCDCKCDNCDGGGGEGIVAVCTGILVGIVCVILFLLPIVVFCMLAAPFWLLAQYFSWKLNDKAPWIVVVLIFIVFLIPPCCIWALMWTAICYNNMTGTFMTVMCQIWSFFYTIYSAFS